MNPLSGVRADIPGGPPPSPQHLRGWPPRYPISNAIECAIRPAPLNRKNALFAGHDEGGSRWGIWASLIGTCKLNGVDPYAYLKATLEALAAGHPQSRLDELMPWSFRQDASGSD
ncbi:hypothetical protein CKO28_26930 [Rhodovibrio sodomensis]|uniref:Transposase IS66 C-terminal domain-containing protein n=1 Tax=Rhodovibrio sodomensis TaxID=1088 RepID=A0ABS1DPJ8_9PROT|nr:hypothetical protein [Rhodovibrio sodomensis]